MTEKNILLADRIERDVRDAARRRDRVVVGALRMIRAALQNEAIAKRVSVLSDDDAIPVLQREAKRRREASDQFAAAGRTDLAEKEAGELDIVTSYLPQQLSDAELQAVVREKKDALGATSSADFGKVMGTVMKAVRGQADGVRVQAAVKEELK